jgi:hypothetical protein
MLKISTDFQHVHTPPHVTENAVLKLAEQCFQQPPQGKMLLDVKGVDKLCKCPVPPEASTWMIILYYLQDVEPAI